MGELSPWHLLIVAAVFVVLFGYKKLPDAARSLGRSARILKTELKDLHDDDPAAAANQPAQLQAAPVAPPVPAPVVPPVAPPTDLTKPAQETVATGDQTPAS
jgi:sec-independent protein translocase protein TatA